jgi:hypothetical protein
VREPNLFFFYFGGGLNLSNERKHWSLAFRTWFFVAILGFGAMYYMYAFVAETISDILGGIFYVIFAIIAGLAILLFGKEIKPQKVNWFALLPVGIIFFFILIGGASLSGLGNWIPQLRSPVPVFVGSENVINITAKQMDGLFALFLVGCGEEVMKFVWIVGFNGQKWAESRIPALNFNVNWLAVGFSTVFWSALHLFLNNIASYFVGLMFVGFTSMLLYYWALEQGADALFLCAVIHGVWDAIIIWFLVA